MLRHTRQFAMAVDFRTSYGPWALVTGASAGIGAEFARQLAGLGLNLVLVARREELLRSLAGQLTAEFGVEIRVVACDLAAVDFLQTVSSATDSLEIGLLVNNAGAPSFHGHFIERDRSEVARLAGFNTSVQVMLCHHFLQPMAQRRRGGVIQVSSVTGHVSMPFMAEYSASKAYQLALGEALYDEMKHWGVDCLVVAPGATISERINYGMAAADVVRSALLSLGRMPSVIPGLRNRLRMFYLRQLLLRRGMVRACGRFQYRHLKRRPWQVDSTPEPAPDR